MKRYGIQFDEARRDRDTGEPVAFCSLVQCDREPCHHIEHVLAVTAAEEMLLRRQEEYAN